MLSPFTPGPVYFPKLRLCGSMCAKAARLCDVGSPAFPVGPSVMLVSDMLPSVKLVGSISVLSSREPTVPGQEHNVAGFCRIQEQKVEGIL